MCIAFGHVMDEVFGAENFTRLISVQTTTGINAKFLGNMSDYILWYGKNKEATKSRPPIYEKDFERAKATRDG